MYNYQTEKLKIFTEDGQETFLKIRDKVQQLLKQSGAVMMQNAISGVTGDSWLHLACVYRLVELKEMRKYIDTFKKFNLNENQNNLPTPEMIDWYQKNTQYMDDWDELDRDVEVDRVRQDFFDRFEDELKGVDMFDVWIKLF